LKTKSKKILDDAGKSSVTAITAGLVQELYPLNGQDALELILQQDNPRELIRQMPDEDFFWLIKKVDVTDSLSILELASEDQWQYLLDLEIWKKDIPDIKETSFWLGMLHQADPERLVRWLFGKGQSLAYYYLFKNIQIDIKSKDDDHDIEEGFFSFDGVYYVNVPDSENRESIEGILRVMARHDLEHYHALLMGMTGIIPAESEEDMYRLRNVRLAEHGFLPFEEALSVYAHLKLDVLNLEEPSDSTSVAVNEQVRESVSVSPLYYARGDNMLTRTFSGISDTLFLDRMRLEFTGLCNQILSADGLSAYELDLLIKTYKKAAGYLNLTLEKLCGQNMSLAENILRYNSLESVFRAGFSQALELKWELDRWLKKSWFYSYGLDLTFWGDEWGRMLRGLMKKRPQLSSHEDNEYRDFSRSADINFCHEIMSRLGILDKLIGRLTQHCALEKSMSNDPNLTFLPMLFNLWARKLLGLEICFLSISLEDARKFFGLLRAETEGSPYKMPGFGETFAGDLMSYAADFEPEAAATLKDTLSLIWKEFTQEYGWVSIRDLDGKFSRFIWIIPENP